MAFPVMFTRAPPAMMLELGEMAMGVGNVVVPALHNANTVRRLQIPIQQYNVYNAPFAQRVIEHNVIVYEKP